MYYKKGKRKSYPLQEKQFIVVLGGVMAKGRAEKVEPKTQAAYVQSTDSIFITTPRQIQM